MKLSAVPVLSRGKRVVMVDDSIVREQPADVSSSSYEMQVLLKFMWLSAVQN